MSEGVLGKGGAPRDSAGAEGEEGVGWWGGEGGVGTGRRVKKRKVEMSGRLISATMII